MRFLALIPVLAPLAMAAPASAATPEAIMADLAANQTHSWVDDGIGFDAMRAKYEAGERLFVTCGNVAEIGRRLLREAATRRASFRRSPAKPSTTRTTAT
jgi:hypothetical protein